MQPITLRQYNGIDIPQRIDGYINATKMCQAGGKQWSNFWQLKSTQEYVDALSSCLGIPRQDLTISGQGGWGNDTWIHPRLASRLAQWISPEFAVVVDGWVLDIIEGRSPVVREASHEGALTRDIAAMLQVSGNLVAAVSAQHKDIQLIQTQQGHVIARIDGIEGKIDGLADDVEEIKKRKRKTPILKHQNIYKQVIWRFFNGACPVYPHLRILETPNKQLQERNRTVGEWDHFWKSHQAGLYQCWLISMKANRDFENGKLNRDDYYQHFKMFQDRVRLVESEIKNSFDVPLGENIEQKGLKGLIID